LAALLAAAANRWKRKEVKTMYTKPEIAVLGEASEVILGSGIKKNPSFDPTQPTLGRYLTPDVELDN